MPELEIDKLRNRARLTDITEFIYATTSLLALPLYLLFWLADLLYAPQYKWQFLFLRLLIIPVCLLTNQQIRRCTDHIRAQIITSVFIACNSAILTVMIFYSEGASSQYYAGLILVGSVLLYMPLMRRFILANTLLLYGPYVTLGLMRTHGSAQWIKFALNMFFISSFFVISVVIRAFLEKLRLSEIDAKFNLGEELRSREAIIKQKTQESIELSNLAKQFSPQVVQSIRSGKLNLDSEQLTTVTVLLTDIVGSTESIRRIPLKQFGTAIDMFNDDAARVLLKYDVTIDKFLGDGVLAFSNAPIPRPDHVTRIVNAALELKERIADRQEEYRRLWQKDFSFRIGIALGEARVGFHGKAEVFKSYTVIGEVVNFASRLCDSAKPNEILVGTEIVESITPDEYLFEKVGRLDLKGFENEQPVVFRILGRRNDHLTISKDIGMCPEGHGVLHLDTDDRGVFIFTCRVCGYIGSGDIAQDSHKKAA